MHELVTAKLVKDMEGVCMGDYFIIAIMDTFDVSEGRILPGNGLAEFTVGYRAVVWRPFKGEVVSLLSQRVQNEELVADDPRLIASLSRLIPTASSARRALSACLSLLLYVLPVVLVRSDQRALTCCSPTDDARRDPL